ncbi:dihydrodipicolinate synthase family protein [Photobacterium sanguinicancri]|uniref:dihydrodipicolinate synthase family protein n=1 Tax=Photobacterium sanguinicancri TaxID=875932 RepID=UPI0026E193CF|nr:dihydrodipicolinate synthase family protein [Photobacterium sanguinicancri]MDO6498809.1 dihydrodipicolinate synthase family protein [Photobacterium sanguinicancri]
MISSQTDTLIASCSVQASQLIPADIFGVNPIVAMPFADNGAVDIESFKQLVKHLIQTGCHGLTLFGIASEFYKLNQDEKRTLARWFQALTSKSQVFSCVSITEHATELAVQQAREYQQQGFDSLMLLPPFFLNPSNDHIIYHIQSVLSAVDIPVLIQYAPTETGIPITPQDMKAITDNHPNAVFKIECNPPVEYAQQLLTLLPDAVIMNGYAGLYMLDMLEVGGKGVMPGCSFTEIYNAIYQLWQDGKKQQAQALHTLLFRYISKWMTHCEYIIAVEKEILVRRGIIATNYCRKPDYPLSELDHQDIDAFLNEFAFILEQYDEG